MNRITSHVEGCINTLVKRFKSLAINFVVEADIQAELFRLLRRGPICKKVVLYNNRRCEICLVHTEWPRVKVNKSRRLQKAGSYDLVIWERASVPNPDRYWGIEPLRRAKDMKLHVVLEIKHRRNSLKPPANWCKQDIEKLGEALKAGKTKYGYYLVFIDEDIESDKRKTKYEEIARWLRRQAKKYEPNLKVACVARSGVEDHWIN